MTAPSPEEVRAALEHFDARHQKIVAGMLTVMIKNPERVREREWISEQLTEIVLLAGGFEANSTGETVAAVQTFLKANVDELLSASFLLFQRVAIDLAPRAEAGFTFDEALRGGLQYLPSLEELDEDAASASTESPEPAPNASAAPAYPRERNLGEQPLARLMAARGLKPADLVSASKEQLTHKMVARAMKGRRLTANTMGKIRRAWSQAVGAEADDQELFDYEP